MTAIAYRRHRATGLAPTPTAGQGSAGSRCPTCSQPALPADLACLWLYPDPNRAAMMVGRRHCEHCQPHHHVSLIECVVCGDGPLLVGYPSPAGATLPDPVTRWLAATGWTLTPALVCANCPGSRARVVEVMGTGTAFAAGLLRVDPPASVYQSARAE